MEITYTKEDEKFRQEVRGWIRESKPKGEPLIGRTQRGPAGIYWRKKLYEKGWLAPLWPKEHGGAGFSIMEQVIFNEECAREGVPRAVGGMGVQMIGPTVIAHGTDEQKKRYLPKMLSGEEVWCQGFSEPNAGSDLGNLQSKAVEDGDDYLITGQKIWTSGAQQASWCFFLARTDTEASKHKGISYFLIDMKTPGIEIRPIKQLTGESHFNEMFFEKVRVPKENLLGGKNKGWYVAMSTLAHERSGIGNAIQFRKSVDRVLDLARKIKKNGVPITKDASVRNRLVQLVFDVHAQTYTGFRSLAKQLQDAIPGPEAYVSKVFTGEFLQRLNAMALELQGPYAQLWVDSPEAVDNALWQAEWLSSRAITIAGGSSEVNRNLIAERALGLPSWKTGARMAKEGKEVG